MSLHDDIANTASDAPLGDTDPFGTAVPDDATS
jgi:hypothetical protein